MTTQEWPHQVKITRAGAVGSGHQDADGVWVPDDPAADQGTVIYDDLGDLQDIAVVLTNEVDGRPILVADGQIFLFDEAKLKDVVTDDLVTVTREDLSVSQGRVTKVMRLDGSLYIQNLE